jgi:hypothetical protein
MSLGEQDVQLCVNRCYSVGTSHGKSVQNDETSKY